MVVINDLESFTQAINSHDRCFVEIGASHCGQCKLVQKNIEDIEKWHSDVYFINVDAEEADDIIEEMEIRNIPVTLVYLDGEMVSKVVGLQTQDQIENRIN